MKIAILGGGFYGCFLASKLDKNNKIHIFEKNNEIFNNTSAILNNQHRLHLGYHYPRSIETINQTIKCYNKFLKDFKEFCTFPKENIYLIHENSKIDFKKYCEIYKNLNLDFKEIDINNIDGLKNKKQFSGGIVTEEGVVKTGEIKKHFEEEFKERKNITINFNYHIKEDDIKKLKNEYDLVINCTYNYPNLGLKEKVEIKHEYCSLLVYENLLNENKAYTIMDGDFVSIYPTGSGCHTISSVSKTPFFKTKNIDSLISYNDIHNKHKECGAKENIIKETKKYFDFDSKKIKKEYLTVKTKVNDDSENDQRESFLKIEDNYASVICGKISAVYDILDELKIKFKL